MEKNGSDLVEKKYKKPLPFRILFGFIKVALVGLSEDPNQITSSEPLPNHVVHKDCIKSEPSKRTVI